MKDAAEFGETPNSLKDQRVSQVGLQLGIELEPQLGVVFIVVRAGDGNRVGRVVAVDNPRGWRGQVNKAVYVLSSTLVSRRNETQHYGGQDVHFRQLASA